MVWMIDVMARSVGNLNAERQERALPQLFEQIGLRHGTGSLLGDRQYVGADCGSGSTRVMFSQAT